MNRAIGPKKKKEYLEYLFGKEAYSRYETFNILEHASELKINRNKDRNVITGLDPYTGPWSNNEAAHLLRRTMFGIKKGELKTIAGMSASSAVDLLLESSLAPAPPINDYNDGTINDPDVPFGTSWINAPWNGDYEGPRINSLKNWMIQNMISQNLNLQEKMLLFWHNHLVTEFWGVFVSKASYNYVETLRSYAFGNFKELIKTITLDVAMLYYLNGAANNKEAPDENYARELQELFCIGKGSGSNYTEGDVQQAAKLLTGWTVDWNTQTTVWYDWLHDSSDKQFSAFYNNTIIQGKSGSAGQQELDELLDMIFENNELALFICRKLYTFFVYAEIDENTEELIIQPLAQIFRNNNYEVKPVIETLLKSEHFFDNINRGVIIKNPIDNLIGIWRSFEGNFPEGSDAHEEYLMKVGMMWSMSNVGMEIGDPPSVAGWPAYYQKPVFDRIWINTSTITQRAIQTDSLIYWGFWTPGQLMNVDVLKFTNLMDNPGDPNALLQEFSELLLGMELGPSSFIHFKAILLSGQTSDFYWTDAWLNYLSDPQNESFKMIVENRLKWTLQGFLQLAEFQLS